ncbi:MAG: RNA repair transcriptional activator RtcR [Phycisphaerales bacterium]
MSKRLVILSLLGTTLDTGRGPDRWTRWRPNVALCQHADLQVDRVELLCPRFATNLAKTIREDMEAVSPSTAINTVSFDPHDPWDFEDVYSAFLDFASAYPFDTEAEDYLVHITTGTHVAQICLFLLTESRRFPARLIQTAPRRNEADASGEYKIIDLDLQKYDSLAARFRKEHTDNLTGLKSGIATRNAQFNRLIERLEQVAVVSTDPLLITGPTGAGKSRLARRVYELKKARRQIEGGFVEVNCATIRGDGAMSTLFGHKKGAFTGAVADRPGLLRAADGGLLFLDEIGELGLDEQAMLLRAIEEKRFTPLGSDREVSSNFQLVAGTNRDLRALVRTGAFREDLLARIDLWCFELPPLASRKEDIEPNLDYELEQFATRTGHAVRFNAEARAAFMRFATNADAAWRGNFRDLSGAITRMGTLAQGGRITQELVEEETRRLTNAWRSVSGVGKGVGAAVSSSALDSSEDGLAALLGAERAAALDRFDRVQLADVVAVCRGSRSLSEAGRTLFAASRMTKASTNDADRLKKYLSKFGLSFAQIAQTTGD